MTALDGAFNVCPKCAPALRSIRDRFTDPARRQLWRQGILSACLSDHRLWHRSVKPRKDDGWSIRCDAKGHPVGMGWHPPRPRIVGKTQWVSGLPIEVQP
jgi:hypothetical protein